MACLRTHALYLQSCIKLETREAKMYRQRLHNESLADVERDYWCTYIETQSKE
jgi:hypothetical protein